MGPGDLRTSPAHRLLQVFISEQLQGIFEVYVDLETRRLCCTCPGWWFKERFSVYEPRCIHTDDVGVLPDDGYAVEMVNTNVEVTVEDAQDALAFRNWVIKNTRVKVSQN